MGIHLAALEEIQKDNIIGPYLLHDIVNRYLIQKLVCPHSTGTLQLNSANVMVEFLKKEASCSSMQTSVLLPLYLLNVDAFPLEKSLPKFWTTGNSVGKGTC